MLIIIVSVLLFLLPINIQPIYAQVDSSFQTQISTTYTVNLNGITQVKHQISIQNTTPSLFISQFDFDLKTTDVTDIKAFSPKGQVIPVNIIHQPHTILAKLAFPDQIVGKNKTRSFTLTYQTNGLVHFQKPIVEILLPGNLGSDNLASHQLTLFVPADFGPLSLSSTSPSAQTSDPIYQKYNFTTSDEKPIWLVFGDHRNLQFQADFDLNNPSISPKDFQVYLIPDFTFQQVYYQTISPLPQSIDRDQYGNWLANYKLEPKTKLHLTAQGFLVIGHNQVPTDLANFKLFTTADPASVCQELNSNSLSPISPTAIYSQFLGLAALHSNIFTQPIPSSLARPSPSVCPSKSFQSSSEVGSVFISTLRSHDIASRPVAGFLFDHYSLPPHSNIPHVWSEIYDSDQKRWLTVDLDLDSQTSTPFYGKNDFSHIALYTSSNTLLSPPASHQPPLDYQANFQFMATDISPQPLISLPVQVKVKFYLPILNYISLQVIVNNTGNSAFYQLPIEYNIFGRSHQTTISYLLPQSHQQIDLGLVSRSFQSVEPILNLNIYGQNSAISFNSQIKLYIIGFYLTFPTIVVLITLYRRHSRSLLV